LAVLVVCTLVLPGTGLLVGCGPDGREATPADSPTPTDADGGTTTTPTNTSTQTPPLPPSGIDDTDFVRAFTDGIEDRRQQVTDYMADSGTEPIGEEWWSDHQKWLWPAVMGVLHAGTGHEDVDRELYEEALSELNEGAFEEHDSGLFRAQFFHFAAVGLTRLICQFPDAFRNGNRKETLEMAVGSTLNDPSGTENHRTMEHTSAYLLGQEAAKEGISGADTLKNIGEKRIRAFVHDLYTMGQGEWDSSIYVGYHMIAYLNLYDFAEDEEIKRLAKAALDWWAMDTGLKYTNVLFGGPERRGGAKRSVRHSMTVLYPMFGDGYLPTSQFSNFEWIYMALTDYTPPKVASDLGAFSVETPFSSFGSKPDYQRTRASLTKETFYATDRYTLGAIYDRQGGWTYAQNQEVMWELAARGKKGGKGVSDEKTHIGHPVSGNGMEYAHRSFRRGRGPFTQVAHHENVLVQMTIVPENGEDLVSEAKTLVDTTWAGPWEDAKAEPGGYIQYPEYVDPVESDGTRYLDLEGTYVAVHPLQGDSLTTATGQDGNASVLIDNADVGRAAGFVIEVGTENEYDSFSTFQNAVASEAVLDTSSLDDGVVTYTNTDGMELKMEYEHDGWHLVGWKYTEDHVLEGEGRGRVPEVYVNGRKMLLGEEWPVYANPYLLVGDKRIAANNRETGLTITMEGDDPASTRFTFEGGDETGGRSHEDLMDRFFE
jgi:hypothetical protein